ncbi:10477_t:CDS:1 [Cetraspora pellucida]|uniref:10477_t:CDS:1 n=1 Tax=Cetraspora pellucida TaxID=1433469 RepID=A0ACA9LNU8_9GLOM|nr:10477_t:CDS:1 [Cetraspora pellucida]
MSFFIDQILEIAPLEYNEQTINLASTNIIDPQLIESSNEPLFTASREISLWIISTKMQEIINYFENTILYQFLCVSCSICSRLMYPEKSEWIQCNPNFQYSLAIIYPNKPLITNPNPSENRIAVCPSCKHNQNRNYPPYLFPVPPEINLVPLHKCKYLSPIHLHCSLGRTSGANSFSGYRILAGTMNYSKNIHSLYLYSGILGAYLNSSDSSVNQHTYPPWFVDSLTNIIN